LTSGFSPRRPAAVIQYRRQGESGAPQPGRPFTGAGGHRSVVRVSSGCFLCLLLPGLCDHDGVSLAFHVVVSSVCGGGCTPHPAQTNKAHREPQKKQQRGSTAPTAPARRPRCPAERRAYFTTLARHR
jgi:hypothetical protein